MSDEHNNKFFIKLLGVFMIEINNETLEKIAKFLWQIIFMFCVVKVVLFIIKLAENFWL